MGKFAEKKVDGIYTIWEARAVVKEQGLEAAVKKIRVVTTGTFEPIEAVGLFFQVQEGSPKMKFSKLTLDEVEAYPYGKEGGGILNSAVGESREDKVCSGAHVIEALVKGKKVRMKAQGQLAGSYLRKDLDDLIDLKTLKRARVEVTISRELRGIGVVNSSEKSIISEFGALLPDNGNISYSGSGDVSPFFYKGILEGLDIGTPVFIGGAIGDVSDKVIGVETELTIRADLKEMDGYFLRAGGFGKSGSALYLGVGIPFEIKSAAELEQLIESNETKMIDIFDLGSPIGNEKPCGKYSYQELSQGQVCHNGKETRTASTASLLLAKEIAIALKEKIEKGEFPICQKQE